MSVNRFVSEYIHSSYVGNSSSEKKLVSIKIRDNGYIKFDQKQ